MILLHKLGGDGIKRWLLSFAFFFLKFGNGGISRSLIKSPHWAAPKGRPDPLSVSIFEPCVMEATVNIYLLSLSPLCLPQVHKIWEARENDPSTDFEKALEQIAEEIDCEEAHSKLENLSELLNKSRLRFKCARAVGDRYACSISLLNPIWAPEQRWTANSPSQ